MTICMEGFHRRPSNFNILSAEFYTFIWHLFTFGSLDDHLRIATNIVI